MAAFVAEWSRERPDLDAEAMLVLGRVEHLAERFGVALRDAFRHEGVRVGEYEILSALRRAGVPFALTPTQLLARTRVTAGAVTKRVDGLEQRGFVERTVTDMDGRGRVVSLTPEGLERIELLVEINVDLQRRVVGDLSPDEVSLLSGLLARLDRTIDTLDRPQTQS